MAPATALAQAPPALPPPPLPADVRVVKDVVYARRGAQALMLDVYTPVAAGPCPVILWIHGGGWFAGDRGDPQALHFLSQGYAVVSIDYRLADQAVFPAPLLDCKAALRFVRRQAGRFGLDPRRIIATGPMSGGHLAALVGLTAGHPAFVDGQEPGDDRVQGVMSLYTVHDFIAWRGVVGGSDHDAPGGSESRLLGAFVLDRPDLARAASPTTYVTAKAPPFFLVQGRRDERVPWSQAKLMDSTLRLAGCDSELWLAEGAIHADPAFWAEPGRARMTAFFERALKKA